MSTDQALIEALEEHHAAAMRDAIAVNGESITPRTRPEIVAIIDIATRSAFLMGAVSQLRNPLPNPK